MSGFFQIFTDLPELEEVQVWLRKIRSVLATNRKAGVGGKREEEQAGKKKRRRRRRRRGQRLQVKDKLRTAREIIVVSAHICYQLEQRVTVTGQWRGG